MTRNIKEKLQTPLTFGIKCSLLGHLGVFLFVLMKSLWFTGKHVAYIPTLKVDLVGLPDVLKKDLKDPTQAQFNQEISKILKQAEQSAKRVKDSSVQAQKNEMALKSNTEEKRTDSKIMEKKNKRALDRIKALSKIQDLPEHLDAAPPQVFKGNKLSPGSTLTGEAQESLKTSYLDLLLSRLQDNWVLPPWISRQNLDAQIQVTLDSRGKMLAFRFVKSSGNPLFDEAVKKALHNSEPFPPPPPDLTSSLVTDGVLIGFPL